MPDINDPIPPPPPELQGTIRFLKLLTGLLAATMIVGLIAIVALLVTRWPAAPTMPTLPEGISLPAGVSAEAVTFGKGWIAVVANEGREILVYDARSGALRGRLAVDGGAPAP